MRSLCDFNARPPLFQRLLARLIEPVLIMITQIQYVSPIKFSESQIVLVYFEIRNILGF